MLLAMDPGTGEGSLKGIDTKEPVFGLPAVWIESEERSRAEVQGFTVVEGPAVLATHLSEVVKSHAGEILSRQDVQKLIDHVKETDKAVVDELIPHQLTVGGVQKVLQRLLRERLSIRDMVTIMESLADHVPLTKDLDLLTENVRQAMGRSIVRQYQDVRGGLSVITVDPAIEQTLADQLVSGERGYELSVDPDLAGRIYEGVGRLIPAALAVSAQPILLCTHVIRPYLRQLLETVFPNLVVLSYREVAGAAQVKSVGTVRLSNEPEKILRAVS
jgi:flagellar biosynthesis protein FlhA